MITEGKKWHYLALKSELVFDGKKWHIYSVQNLLKLIRGVTSNHNGDPYCLSCLHSFRAKNVLKNMKDYVISMITVM